MVYSASTIVCYYMQAFPPRNRITSHLTHICRVDPSILINWTSPFLILGVSGVLYFFILFRIEIPVSKQCGERGGSVVECRTPEREVRGSRPTAAVLCPWARHFTPRKYWLITQEAMAPSRYDWKIVDWDVKPQYNQPTNQPNSVNPDQTPRSAAASDLGLHCLPVSQK